MKTRVFLWNADCLMLVLSLIVVFSGLMTRNVILDRQPCGKTLSLYFFKGIPCGRRRAYGDALRRLFKS